MISLGSDLIASLDGQALTVIRSAGGGYVNGFWVENAEEELDIIASVQPLNDIEIEFVPEGDRTKAARKLYTATELRVHDSETSAKPDLVEIEGEYYKVIRVQRWQGHFKCLVVRESEKPYVDQKPGNLTLSVTAGNLSFALSWTASQRATSYNVMRGTSPGAGINTTIQTGLTSTTFNDNTTLNNITYYYKIVAVNAVGTKNSNEDSDVFLEGTE
jgi:hypothetical protein